MRPEITLDNQFSARYPKILNKIESWKSKSIVEDFLKIEHLIEYVRKQEFKEYKKEHKYFF